MSDIKRKERINVMLDIKKKKRTNVVTDITECSTLTKNSMERAAVIYVITE